MFLCLVQVRPLSVVLNNMKYYTQCVLCIGLYSFTVQLITISCIFSGCFPSPHPGEVPYVCTFEQGTCNLIQVTNDNFNWVRQSGVTDTQDTGPSAGQGPSLYYFYIEASSPRILGDRAM